MKITQLIFFLPALIMVACQPQNNQSLKQEEDQKETVLVNEKEAIEKELQNKADSFSLDYIMGKFDPAKHPDFERIDVKYASREGLYLHQETYEAFKKMHAAALNSGVQLKILSATRNFYSQKGIWEAKWTGQRKVEDGKDASVAFPDPEERALKILEYSSMPSTSRHHWGTDVDLNSLNNSYFEKEEGLKIYNWLIENAAGFGFCQPYTEKGTDRPYGYNEEKWHWSYLPIARALTYKASKELKDEMVTGFQGSEVATDIGVVEKYVLGINSDCK